MDSKHTNPDANAPQQKPNEPLGDRGEGDKTWSPEQGKQGISNRPDDQDQNQEAEEPTESSKDPSKD